MSEEVLRELLRDLGSDHPPVRIAPDTYRRGRRARRRRVALGSAAGAVAVVALGSGLAPLVDPDVPGVPAGSLEQPAMPSRIHDVPERLASHEEDGYRWHADVAAGELSIGTTAAVFPVNMGAVMAVSAEDGGYRGLDLPGFDEDSYFRFQGAPVALSPDGRRLAYTWNPDVIGGSERDGYRPSGVRVLDLATGKVRSARIRGGFGVHAHAFSWSPDGRWLAYNLDVTTDSGGGVRGARNFRIGRLDTATWRTVEVRGIPRVDTGPAVSSRGEVVTVGNGTPATWALGRTPVVRRIQGGEGTLGASWSPDSRRLVTGSWEGGRIGLGSVDRGLDVRPVDDVDPDGAVRPLGWLGTDEVVLLHGTDDAQQAVTVVPADVRREDGRRLLELEHHGDQAQLSLATDLLDRPTRSYPAPDWPADPARVVAWSVAGALGLAVVTAWWGQRLRRRRP